MNPVSKGLLCGREIEYFHHPSEEAWGYAAPQEDTFAVIHPQKEDIGKKYPLFVVFHSAGHDVHSCIGCMPWIGNHDIYDAPPETFALVLDCWANKKTDWWWGGDSAFGAFPERNGTAPQPVERRCVDTILWVCGHFAVDTDRVYAVGNSMGGSGALGIGMRHGEIFAAVKANVPAGARHAAARCALAGERPEGFSIPDPPIVVDYSAQNDGWSRGHEVLYRGAQAHKYPLIGFFGPFGHANNNREIFRVNDLIHAFDITAVRKNEAYPVFTGASTDDPIPWPDNCESEASGQVNGFFRWNVEQDETRCFAVALRLLRQDEWDSRVRFPGESTADVSVRRLQCFRLAPGEEFAWEYGGQRGVGRADAEGVPTVERLCVTQTPTVLRLTR